MKFGMCIGGDREKIAVCKKLGFDYVESGFSLLTDENEENYDLFAAALKENDFPCISVNCFLPGSLKVTGPEVDNAALSAYIERGMRRGAALGVKKVVFGSGGARRIPEGFPYEEAVRQIFSFLSEIVSPIAEKYGITVVIEPLSLRDTNFIHTVGEGAIIAAAVNKENIRLLADLFHVNRCGDTNESIAAMRGLLRHAHIAEPVNRRFPSPQDTCDYKGFVDALEAAGCDTCSVEASCENFEEEAAGAIRVLRAL